MHLLPILIAAGFLGVGGPLVLAAYRTRGRAVHRALQFSVMLDALAGGLLIWHGLSDRRVTRAEKEYPVAPGVQRVAFEPVEAGAGLHVTVRPRVDLSWRTDGEWRALGSSNVLAELPQATPIEVRSAEGATLVASLDLRTRRLRRIRTGIEAACGGGLAFYALIWIIALLCAKKQ